MSVRELDLCFKEALTQVYAERVAQVTTHPDEEDLAAYYAGELQGAQQDELQAHLVACRACGDTVLELDRVKREERQPWAACQQWMMGLGALVLRSLRAAAQALPRGRARLITLVSGVRDDVSGGGRAVWLVPALAVGAAAVFLSLPVLIAHYYARDLGVGSLGGYVLEVRGEQMRGGGGGEHSADKVFRFAPGGTLQLILYPEEPVAGAVAVEAFLEHAGRFERWPAPMRIWEEGAVRIKGRVGADIMLPPGYSDLYVTLGRPGQLPLPDELQRQLAKSYSIQERDWAAWRVRVSLAGDGVAQ